MNTALDDAILVLPDSSEFSCFTYVGGVTITTGYLVDNSWIYITCSRGSLTRTKRCSFHEVCVKGRQSFVFILRLGELVLFVFF